MDNLNETIETLRTQFELLKQKDSRSNKTALRKTLQDLKNKCHALRKEILGKTKAVVVPIEPVEPVAQVEPVVAEVIPEPVESHPIPESKPKLTKKRKKVKKV